MRLELFPCWFKKYDQYIQSCIPVQVEICRFRTKQFLQVMKRHFGSTVAGQHIYNITMTTVSLWKKVIRAANLDGGSCCAGTVKSLHSFFYWQSAKIRQESVASPSPALSPFFVWFIKFDNDNVNSVAAAFPTDKSTQKKPFPNWWLSILKASLMSWYYLVFAKKLFSLPSFWHVRLATVRTHQRAK